MQKIIDSYNNSYHRSIKMKPTEVTDENAAIVKRNLFPRYLGKQRKVLFKPNDRVKVSLSYGPFEKGYKQGWSTETYIVDKVKLTKPPVYDLKLLDGEPLLGSMYAEELIKVTPKWCISRVT